MSGTVKLTIAQHETLTRSVKETGMGVVDITLNNGVNGMVAVALKTPGFGVLNFRIDRSGKRLPSA